MTLGALRQAALALPVLVAALLCGAFPTTALAEPGKGNGKGQRDDSSYQQSRDYRDDSGAQRGNGKSRGQQSDRENSSQQYQGSDNNYYGKNRSENSGRGYSNEKYRTADDNYDYNRNRDNSGRGNSSQQYRTTDQNYYNGRQNQQSQSLSAQGAAQRARSQFGGQVIKVQPSGQGYQVRLLKDDGRVVTVPIAD